MKKFFAKLSTNLSYWIENIVAKYDQTNLVYFFLVAWLVALMTTLLSAAIMFAIILIILFLIDKISIYCEKPKNLNLLTKNNDNVKFALIGGLISLLFRIII